MHTGYQQSMPAQCVGMLGQDRGVFKSSKVMCCLDKLPKYATSYLLV